MSSHSTVTARVRFWAEPSFVVSPKTSLSFISRGSDLNLLHALFCICVASNRNWICIERVPSWRLSHGGSSYCRRGGFCCLFQLARDFILRCEKCRCVKRVCARGLAQSDGRRNHKRDCSKMLECGPFVKIDSPWPCRGQKEFLRPSRAAPHHNWWQGVIARSFGPKQSRRAARGGLLASLAKAPATRFLELTNRGPLVEATSRSNRCNWPARR
jgi:hypothetical protein